MEVDETEFLVSSVGWGEIEFFVSSVGWGEIECLVYSVGWGKIECLVSSVVWGEIECLVSSVGWGEIECLVSSVGWGEIEFLVVGCSLWPWWAPAAQLSSSEPAPRLMRVLGESFFHLALCHITCPMCLLISLTCI